MVRSASPRPWLRPPINASVTFSFAPIAAGFRLRKLPAAAAFRNVRLVAIKRLYAAYCSSNCRTALRVELDCGGGPIGRAPVPEPPLQGADRIRLFSKTMLFEVAGLSKRF